MMTRLGSGLFLVLLTSEVFAACPPFHTLTNGSPADASQVMDNLNAILGCPDFVGNVGIGTASPQTQLDIVNTTTYGYSQMRYANTGHAWHTGVGSAAEFTYGVANKFYLFDANNNAMRLTADTVGNIGIGTTSPASLGDGGAPKILQVDGGAGYSLMQLSSSQTANGGNTGAITFGTTAATGTRRSAEINSTLTADSTTNASGDLSLYTFNAGTAVTALYLSSSGNIGFGTNSPSSLGDGGAPKILQVDGGAGYSLMQLSSSQTAYGGNTGAITFGTTAATGAKRSAEIVSTLTAASTTNASGDLSLYTFNAGTAVNALYLSSSGNVGFGTTTPTAKVSFPDVNASSTADGITWYSGSPESFGIFRSAGSWSAPNYQQLNVSWTTGIVINGGNAYGRSGTVLQPTGGNVGIGTATPGQTLDVAGTIRQSNCISGTLSANASGDIVCTSDARLKNIRNDYTDGLAALVKITPKRFTYKSTKLDPVEIYLHAGFVAQNVKLAIPEAVAVQKSGYYSLDTTAILAASVNAIKQLKALNDQQAAVILRQNAFLAKQFVIIQNLRTKQEAEYKQVQAIVASLRNISRITTAAN